MAKESHTMNRRSILKTIGATGAGLSFTVGEVSAEESGDQEISWALESEGAQEILSALGHPQPGRTDHPNYERMGPFKIQRDEATTVELSEETSDESFETVKIPTDIGFLGVGGKDGDALSVQFYFDDLSRRDRHRLSRLWNSIEYRQGTNLFLMFDGEMVYYGRSTTRSEQQEMQSLLPDDISVERTAAYQRSKDSGYRVIHEDGYAEIDADLTTVVESEGFITESSEISAQGHEDFEEIADDVSDTYHEFVECAGYDIPGCVSDIGTTYTSCEVAGTACSVSVATGPYGWAACATAFSLICAPAIAAFGLSNSCKVVFDCATEVT